MTEGTQQQQQEPLVVAYQRESGDSLTKYDLGTLAVRLFGLYCLSNALTYAAFIPNLFLYQSSSVAWGGLALAAYCVPCVVFSLVGVLLLVRTRVVVRWAFPELAAGTALSATGRDLQAVLFSVVGVWLVAATLPEVARVAVLYGRIGSGASSNDRLQLVPEAARVVVELGAGVFLFARARGLSALWHRLRYAGLQEGSTP